MGQPGWVSGLKANVREGASGEGAHVGIRRKTPATLSRAARGDAVTRVPGVLRGRGAARPALAGRPTPAKETTAVTAAPPVPPAPHRAHQPSHHTRTARLPPGPGRSAPPASPCPFRIMAPNRRRGTAGSRLPAAAARARTRRHAGLTRLSQPMPSTAPPRARSPAPSPPSRGQWRAPPGPGPAPPLPANNLRPPALSSHLQRRLGQDHVGRIRPSRSLARRPLPPTASERQSLGDTRKTVQRCLITIKRPAESQGSKTTPLQHTQYRKRLL